MDKLFYKTLATDGTDRKVETHGGLARDGNELNEAELWRGSRISQELWGHSMRTHLPPFGFMKCTFAASALAIGR